MVSNRNHDGAKNGGRFAIDSWEDEGGALRYAPLKKAVPQKTNPFAMLALVGIVATGFCILWKTLISGRNYDES